jgi:hypothetical protein
LLWTIGTEGSLCTRAAFEKLAGGDISDYRAFAMLALTALPPPLPYEGA